MKYKQLILQAISECRFKAACRLLERSYEQEQCDRIHAAYLVLVDGIQHGDYYSAATLAIKLIR